MSQIFSFSGRLSRKPIWIYILVLSILYIFFGLIIAHMSGGNAFMSVILAPQAVGILLYTYAMFNNQLLFLIIVPVYLFIFISGISFMARRLHDRDRSAWWVMVVVFLPIIVVLGATLTAKLLNFGFAMVLVFTLIAQIIQIWAFVELGFLKGTNGPNRFGPDPLDAKQ